MYIRSGSNPEPNQSKTLSTTGHGTVQQQSFFSLDLLSYPFSFSSVLSGMQVLQGEVCSVGDEATDYRGNSPDKSKTGGWLGAGLILGVFFLLLICTYMHIV